VFLRNVILKFDTGFKTCPRSRFVIRVNTGIMEHFRQTKMNREKTVHDSLKSTNRPCVYDNLEFHQTQPPYSKT
jgi:hypothetical protein